MLFFGDLALNQDIDPLLRSLNDELVYKTRVKPITSSPMFNAGTERFVRDWRKSHVTIAVKDSRMRENDAILGVVMLKVCLSYTDTGIYISDAFQPSSPNCWSTLLS